MTTRVLTAVVMLALSADLSFATSIRFVPVPERVARADAVALGTVTNIEEKSIEAERYAGGEKIRYRIAVVKVTDRMLGAGEATHLRVAFVPREDQPNDGLRIGTPVLDKGDEVLLFLRKREDEGFYRLDGYFGAVKKADKFEDVIKEAKTASKLLSDADKALKSKDQTERMTVAWLLTIRYRTPPVSAVGGKAPEEAIGAAESQAILEGLLVLAEKNAETFRMAVRALNLSRDDGLDQSFTNEKAKAWVKDNTKTYRIKKFVPAKK